MPAQFVLVIYLCSLGLFCQYSKAQASSTGRYDIVYFEDSNLDAALDFKEKLETMLGPEVTKSLKIVRTRNRYGVVYDRSGTPLSSARLVVHHNSILEKVGMQGTAVAIGAGQYSDLYNVSYGLGVNLVSLKHRYEMIYRYLGQDVGKDLFIEKTRHDNYILVYRRLGDRQSTLRVANRHDNLLKRKGVAASIALSQNNEIVFGESSYLDMEDKPVPRASFTATKASPTVPKHKTSKTAKRFTGKTDDSATLLEKKIEKYIKELRRKNKITSDERTAWLAYDLTTGRNLIDINIHTPLQAASMMKPFVALAFFLKEKEGALIYGPKSRQKMEAMIQRSDNKATNWLMRHIGGPKAVEDTLKKQYPNIFQSIKIVEYIPANGGTYRNKVAPREYGMFLAALWNKKLSSGKEIRRLMALPNRDRIYHGTPLPRGTLVFDKTGTTAKLCGDMGILVPKGRDGRRYPYIIVGIIEKQKRARNYGHWMASRGNIIRNVSSLVYSSLKEEYSLL
nr:serine hydrolase [Desulfobulbaceae bacterium]